jgi:hypothetical protein
MFQAHCALPPLGHDVQGVFPRRLLLVVEATLHCRTKEPVVQSQLCAMFQSMTRRMIHFLVERTAAAAVAAAAAAQERLGKCCSGAL